MINLKEFKEIVFNGKELNISIEDYKNVENCYKFLYSFLQNKIIYGINTGFGPMAQYKIPENELTTLQYNVIRSHAAGVGKPLDEIFIKASMLCRFYTFLKGKSGVHTDTIILLKEFINRGIFPLIPEHGSVGASGDLVQLAHLALTLIGEGEVFYKGKLENTEKILKIEGLQPLKMYIREGLALTNGTSVMTGIGLINLIYSKKLMEWALISSTLINEIASSFDDFMSIEYNDAKLHRGQQQVANIMRKIADGSTSMLNRQKELYESESQENYFKRKIQPYYSLRCVPQILGPVYDEMENAEIVMINELNSVDDNPIIDLKNKTVLHGGNFHGDYVSYEMDKLKIGVTKLTMLIERQLNYLLHSKINEILPPFVNLGTIGLNYGMQGMQFTATSTTAECQTLSNPMYIHSIPNNNDNQDIVSMGTNSAMIAKHIIENSFQVLAIHAIALVQAVDYLKIENKLAHITKQFYTKIREIVPKFKDDNPKYMEIEKIVKILKIEETGLMVND